MTITSTVAAVEVATCCTLPEKVVQFMKLSFSPSEFPKGYLFVKREHLIFYKGDVQEYFLSGIH
jgi:hypothetical protein